MGQCIRPGWEVANPPVRGRRRSDLYEFRRSGSRGPSSCRFGLAIVCCKRPSKHRPGKCRLGGARWVGATPFRLLDRLQISLATGFSEEKYSRAGLRRPAGNPHCAVRAGLAARQPGVARFRRRRGYKPEGLESGAGSSLVRSELPTRTASGFSVRLRAQPAAQWRRVDLPARFGQLLRRLPDRHDLQLLRQHDGVKRADHLVWLAAPAALAAASVPAAAHVYLTESQALAAVLGEFVSVQREQKILSDAQRRKLEEASGLRVPEPSSTFLVGTRQGQLIGYALVLDEIGKSEPITFMVGMSPEGKVTEVAVMGFCERRRAGGKRKKVLPRFARRSPGAATPLEPAPFRYTT